MAFGFPASYEIECELISSRQTARLAVIYAFEALKWRFTSEGRDRYYAQVTSSMTGGEEVSISLEKPNVIKVKSVCTWPLQLYDWGNNKRNAEQFLGRFTPKEIREIKLPGKEARFLDGEGKTPLERAIDDVDEG